MVKNTGIPENQLSNLDYPQVLKDSHNKPLHALDVNQINSLVPSSFTKVDITRDSSGNITIVQYYGLGLVEKFSLGVRDNVQGTYEISTLFMTSRTPADLDGKYFIIYDDVGSVGVWFDLDGGSTSPTTGATRDIEVDIITGDSSSDLASKLVSAMNSDSKFSASAVSSVAVIQSSTVGNKTDATQGTTSISITVTDGIASLAGQSFDISYYDNSDTYTYYYSIDGNSGSYSPGTSDIEIALTSSDTSTTTATKTATVINNQTYLSSTNTSALVYVDYLREGNATGFTDVDTGFESVTIQVGQDKELVSTIYITYDDCGQISGVERV